MSRFKVDEELTKDPMRIRVSETFSSIVERAENNNRSVTPAPAKNYFQFVDLVNKAIIDYQSRLKSPNSLTISWENPDINSQTERITVGLVKREPGKFDQGAPFEGSVKNLRPLIRENVPDPDAPGYRKVISGKWYDNLIRFTCWAQTNKEAIERAFWFESFMEKYTWFFVASGVPRVIFWGQESDTLINNDGQKLYGRPLLFYVKTEELTEISEKEIEEIFINLLVVK